MLTYPQQVLGHVALPVPKASPPPLGLTLVLAPQDGDGIPFVERQLIAVLGLIAPQSVHHSFVHHAQLLLHPWDETVSTRSGGPVPTLSLPGRRRPAPEVLGPETGVLLAEALLKVNLTTATWNNSQKSTRKPPDCSWVWGAPNSGRRAPRPYTTATKPAPAWSDCGDPESRGGGGAGGGVGDGPATSRHPPPGIAVTVTVASGSLGPTSVCHGVPRVKGRAGQS